MTKNKYFVLLALKASVLTLVLMLFAVPKAHAQTPAGCVYDSNGVVTTTTTDGAGCRDTLLSGQNVTDGSYWYIKDIRVSENPCRNDAQIRQVSQAEFETLRNQPTTTSRCGAPPPPPSIQGASNTIAQSQGLGVECRNPGDRCSISDHLTTFVRVLSAMVGIVVVIMIAVGGVQYTQSHDNPQQTAEAKDHIRNALIALVFYIFSIAILNWLVPGGVL